MVRANSSVLSPLARSNNASSLARTCLASAGLFMRDASCSAWPLLISPAASASRVLDNFSNPSAVLAARFASRDDIPPALVSRSAGSLRRRFTSAATSDRRAATAESTLANAVSSASKAARSNPDTARPAESPLHKQFIELTSR